MVLFCDSCQKCTYLFEVELTQNEPVLVKLLESELVLVAFCGGLGRRGGETAAERPLTGALDQNDLDLLVQLHLAESFGIVLNLDHVTREMMSETNKHTNKHK